MGATKKIRTTLLVASAAWLLALSLACGGSGDEDESTEGAAVAAAPTEPAAPPDPFATASVTMEQLAEQLERMATQQPAAFNRFGGSGSLAPGAVGRTGGRNRITLSLRWSPGLGANGQPVFLKLVRMANGDVRVGGLEAQNAVDGGAAYTAPVSIQAVAQTARLRIMDQNCDLPYMNDAEMREALGYQDFLQRPAREAQANCAAAATAFGATPLRLSYALIATRYPERPGSAVLTSLDARIASGAQLTFSRPSFTYAR